MKEIRWNKVKLSGLKPGASIRLLCEIPPRASPPLRAGLWGGGVKSERLKLVRGVSFEEIITAEFIKFKKHSAKESQSIMLFRYRGYIWVVPYVETKDYKFLKTLYPSRKYTKLYKRGTL